MSAGTVSMPSYASFTALQDKERSGVDYRIRVRYGHSGIAVMAIHGGGIEPGTTEIADAIASDAHTFYSFSGLKTSGNAELHISSRKFDEPVGVEIAEKAWTVVTIHGCKDRKAMTYVGGRHAQLKLAIKQGLAVAGFPVADAMRFPGVNPKNICNRNRLGMGLQLEISLGMRQVLFEDLSRLQRNRVTPSFLPYVRALQASINWKNTFR
jgi:phage replication-related protein YjqB (UPF0714/DUF867 family)